MRLVLSEDFLSTTYLFLVSRLVDSMEGNGDHLAHACRNS